MFHKQILVCDNFYAVLGYGNGIFPLGGKRTVLGINRPFVFFIYEEILFAFVYHGFNRKDHAGHKKHPCSSLADMANVRVLMEIIADPMTADITQNSLAMLMDILADHCADIAQSAPRLYFLQG